MKKGRRRGAASDADAPAIATAGGLDGRAPINHIGKRNQRNKALEVVFDPKGLKCVKCGGRGTPSLAGPRLSQALPLLEDGAVLPIASQVLQV